MATALSSSTEVAHVSDEHNKQSRKAYDNHTAQAVYTVRPGEIQIIENRL